MGEGAWFEMTLKTITPVQSIEEAVHLLNDPAQTSQVLAGGAGISMALRFGRLGCDRLIDISGVVPLHQVELVQVEKQPYLMLGTGLSLSQLEKHPLIQAEMPHFAEVLHGSSDPARRNAYTLGGRLAARRNTGLLFPVFAVLDAVVVIVNTSGETRVPVLDWLDAGQTESQGLITAVLIPHVRPVFWQCEEVKRRQMPGELLAGVVTTAAAFADGAPLDLRIATYVEGWGVIRWERVEQRLNGQAASDSLFQQAADELVSLLEMRWGNDADTRYRLQVLPALMFRCLKKIWQHAREE
jgi:CO/xanthine dehydrogenase FAD-binding subunit